MANILALFKGFTRKVHVKGDQLRLNGHQQADNKMNNILIVLLTITCGMIQSVAARHCDDHHFWDPASRVCKPCAKCPLNEIIYKPCGSHTDTVCRPFREFNDFKLLESLELQPSFTSYEYDVFQRQNFTEFDQEQDIVRVGGIQNNEPIVQKDDGQYWKNLAFALIGVVCVLVFVATVIVLLACRKLHETSAIKRPEEEDDDDSGYVVIRTIRPPNMVYRPPPPTSSDFAASPAALALLGHDERGAPLQAEARLPLRKGSYKPKRRLLNYDADDVFESEDSSGSRTSRRGPLQPIPERSSEGV